MTIIRRDELVDRDGILHRADAEDGAEGISEYRRRWETEAAEDHIRSAIADASSGPVDLAALTAKTSPLWDRFPAGKHFETVLEIGAGYGRIPLYLANSRGVTWSNYCAVDISENMLRELLGYERAVRPEPGGEPLSDLRFGGLAADRRATPSTSRSRARSSCTWAKDSSSARSRRSRECSSRAAISSSTSRSPNSRNPASFHSRLKPRRLRAPNFMKYWTRDEVEALLQSSGLAAKAGATNIEPAGYTLLPKRVGPVPVPFARRVNSALGPSPRRHRGVLATTYNAYSTGLLA